jgi:hypothetical protein
MVNYPRMIERQVHWEETLLIAELLQMIEPRRKMSRLRAPLSRQVWTETPVSEVS